eukprot:CAMPEP_0182550758 /NCGR_PEP_ID=MMETSP1323-20130603/42538_1 /TAXON_ID=236787 /ORGANISM="Florenciella parvula, Strain RCC1693" /LENGTH=65 /DNA_ID=CAMNT_0024762317 /DNA_START=1 /DNA_END=198 /DNA_ORIENTATION=-
MPLAAHAPNNRCGVKSVFLYEFCKEGAGPDPGARGRWRCASHLLLVRGVPSARWRCAAEGGANGN